MHRVTVTDTEEDVILLEEDFDDVADALIFAEGLKAMGSIFSDFVDNAHLYKVKMNYVNG